MGCAYYRGDFNAAIKRCNQGWLFDRENPEICWGFGLIMGQRASQEDPEQNLKEAIRFLKLANKKDPKNGRIIGDLAFSYTILGHYYKAVKKNDMEAQKHYESAGELFNKAFKNDPKYPPTVANWSVFYFSKETTRKPKAKPMRRQKWATGLVLITTRI